MRFILFALIVVFASSCSSNTNEIKNVKQKKQNTPVKAIVVSATTLTHKIQSSGTVLSNEEVELRNEISGRVIKINFHEGAFVKKDMVLVKMYDEDLQAQLKKIKIQEELARSEESRKRQLFEQQVISQQEYDIVLSQFNSLKADVELLKAQISKTEIKAPFAGFIGLRSISEGSFITPSTIIATLQQTDPVKIEFSVPEQYSQYLKPGLKINLTTERAKDYTALVYAVEPKIDFNTRTIKVRAHCSNPKNEIIPGSFVKVETQLSQIKNAIVLPSEVVIPALGDQKIYTYNNGKAKLVSVITGIRTNNTVQILKGINPGDTIITTGIMMLREGANVTLQEISTNTSIQ